MQRHSLIKGTVSRDEYFFGRSTPWAQAKEAPHIPTWHLMALMKVPWSVGSRHHGHWHRKHSTFLPGTWWHWWKCPVWLGPGTVGTGTGSTAHSYLALDSTDESALVGRIPVPWALAQETQHIPTWHLMALMKVPWSVGSRHRGHWHRKYLVSSKCFLRADLPHLQCKNKQWGNSFAGRVVRTSDDNAKVATVLDSIPASSDTVKSGWQ